MLKMSSYTSTGTKREDVNMPKKWQAEVNELHRSRAAKYLKKDSSTYAHSSSLQSRRGILERNKKLLAQAIRVYSDRKHPGLAKVKTRGEVSISTRKIYKQKGTGGARHGAKSAPIFVGGGVTHGPRGLKRRLKLSRKIGQKALNIALNMKAEEKRLIVVSNLSSLKKTKEASVLLGKVMKNVSGSKNPNLTLILARKNKGVERVFRNLKNVSIAFSDDLNAYEVYFGGLVIVDADSLEEGRKSSVKETKTVPKKSVKAAREPKTVKKKAL